MACTEKEAIVPSNRAVYAELITTVIVVAMVCATMLTTTSMWVSESATEINYLRGSTP